MLKGLVPSIGKSAMNREVARCYPTMENLQKFNWSAAHQVPRWTTLLNAMNLYISRLMKVCADTHVLNREKRNGKGGQYWVNAFGGMQEKVNCVNKCKKTHYWSGFRGSTDSNLFACFGL